MTSSPISFLSDYGSTDEFVGVVHGVIARIAPEVQVIDITHHVPRGDIRAGALALLRAIQYLPDGVVLAVVDPGVGTGRRALAASTGRGFFVGPDNGLLAPAVAMVGGAEAVVSLEDARFHLPRQGITFDGRDVFAPAAAVLASGEATLDDLGPRIEADSISPLLLPLTRHADDAVFGEVWWVDGFGNAQTNVSPAELEALGLAPGQPVDVRVGPQVHRMPWLPTFGASSSDDDLGILVVDGSGMVAVAVPGGRADETYNLDCGTAIGFMRPTGAE